MTVNLETPQKLTKKFTVKHQKKYLNNTLWNAGQDIDIVNLPVFCQKCNYLFASFLQFKALHSVLVAYYWTHIVSRILFILFDFVGPNYTKSIPAGSVILLEHITNSTNFPHEHLWSLILFVLFIYLFIYLLIALLLVRIIYSTASQRNTSLFIRQTNLLSFNNKNLKYISIYLRIVYYQNFTNSLKYILIVFYNYLKDDYQQRSYENTGKIMLS